MSRLLWSLTSPLKMDSSVTNPSVWGSQQLYKHHEQRTVAQTRPKYREGRRLKAVKVYTINLESRFLLVQGVPAIGVMTELVQLFALYGVIEEYRALDEYPAEQFTEVYLIQFKKLTSARVAKRHTDEKSFFGGQLHVCYAPEYETVEETRQKLQDRRRYVNRASQNTAKQHNLQLEENTVSSCTNTQTSAAPEIQKGSEKARMENVNSDDMGFSVLPLAPEDNVSYKLHGFEQPLQLQWTTDTTLPTEDKMGSLHNAIPPVTEKETKQCASSASCKKERDLIERQKNLSPSVRFMPRTTHLESRKRKLEGQAFFLNEAAETETLIGPKLPELPKVDMEDHSLNVTASLIRQTMSKVTSVPEIKPVQVKTPTAKPRRRI
ncbi:RNA-binding protein 48-like [Carassius carassius]|uniref:RNA-binding protein 48-like n=1 Tax=Carassius carassius TaxID=217509 RepID=UPI0028691C4B|nr:RNA-binding protein 48-like [Carassius carassius]